MFEYDDTGTLLARYTHGPELDQPLIMARDLDSSGVFDSGEFFFYHADGLGSITELTDETGAIVRAYAYDAFGRIVAETGTLENPYAYTGREFDAESGLYFYRARYYDAQMGRFISEDPLRFKAGDVNFYGYVLNDPINLLDPFGLTADCPCSPPPASNDDWKPYEGDPDWFHCNYNGVVENRDPDPNDPQAECFYDENDVLVGDNHPYAGCKGTPNQYDDWVRHFFIDSGGVAINLLDPFGLTADCPCSPPPASNDDWKPYEGDPDWFHCNYNGVVENRDPDPNDPQAECFYDENDVLVGDNHPYAGCKGTPNQYDDWVRHFFIDSGGVLGAGGPAYSDSRPST